MLRPVLLVPAALVLVGCVTPTLSDPIFFDVIANEQEDFARYQTWDWLPVDAPNGFGVAPSEQSHPLLQQLSATLARELVSRGYRRRVENPDFYVTYKLLRHVQSVKEAHRGAQRTLSSLSHQGTFVVDAPELTEKTYVTAQLHIGMAETSRMRITWLATFRRRVEKSFSPYLDASIAHVLDHWPPPMESLEARAPPAAPEGKAG